MKVIIIKCFSHVSYIITCKRKSCGIGNRFTPRIPTNKNYFLSYFASYFIKTRTDDIIYCSISRHSMKLNDNSIFCHWCGISITYCFYIRDSSVSTSKSPRDKLYVLSSHVVTLSLRVIKISHSLFSINLFHKIFSKPYLMCICQFWYFDFCTCDLNITVQLLSECFSKEFCHVLIILS